MKLTNADFRKLLMTPRAPTTGVSESTPATQKASSVFDETPQSQSQKGDDKSMERRKKKRYCVIINFIVMICFNYSFMFPLFYFLFSFLFVFAYLIFKAYALSHSIH